MDKTAEYYLSDWNIVAFPKMGIEFHINSVAFTIFGFEIRWYGVIIAFGLLLAMLYGFKRMKEFGLDSDRAIDCVLGGIVGGIVGARLYYILFDSDNTLADFFKIRQGGLAIYGGLIGALLVALLIAKFRKVKILPLLDIASLGFFIGQGIGRWGNFVNKEAFGSATEMPWGMATATVQDTLGNGTGAVVLAHPCFLYESLWCIAGFVLLHFYSKKRRFDGEVFLLYSAWYGLGRFFIEGLRMDSLYLGRLRISQLVAALCVVVSLTIFFIQRGHVKREGFTLYCNTEESKQLLLEAEERAANASNKSKVAAADENALEDNSSAILQETAVEDSDPVKEASVDSTPTDTSEPAEDLKTAFEDIAADRPESVEDGGAAQDGEGH